MSGLEGKVALVTGGGTGIGKGIAERFAAEGMRLAVAGLDIARNSANQYGAKNLGGFTAAKDVAKSLGNNAIAIEADVCDAAQVDAMIEETASAFGQVDVVANAAGVVTVKPVQDITETDWDSVLDVNLKGTFLVNKAVVAHMRGRGGGGRIINVASIAGKMGVPLLSHYCASKWGVIGFSNALAREIAPEGITVNCICPGIVGTQMWTLLQGEVAEENETPEQAYQRMIQNIIPQGIPQTVEDMADLAVYFATAPHVTGQAFNVDGGATM